jgi:hypothetical protein
LAERVQVRLDEIGGCVQVPVLLAVTECFRASQVFDSAGLVVGIEDRAQLGGVTALVFLWDFLEEVVVEDVLERAGVTSVMSGPLGVWTWPITALGLPDPVSGDGGYGWHGGQVRPW